ncbi:MAG: hypothetical protein ACOY5R_12560 [Pseudomonadota bacterium]
MGIELLGAVTPIHMIGESHSIVFGNLLFRPAWSKTPYLCRTRFLPTLLASDYAVGDDIDNGYLDALIAEGIFDASLRPAFMHCEPSAAYIAGQPLIAPPMVLFAGDLDIHKMFLDFTDRCDFILPDDPGYGVDKTKNMLAHAEVVDHVLALLTPFLQTVEQLQAAGFGRLMIHCLPPRTADDERAARWTRFVFSAAVRTKITIVANRLLEEFCLHAGIAFIDTWPELTEGGYLKPEFDLDGCHVNRAAAQISLEKISDVLIDRTARNANPSRYSQAHLQADRRPAAETPDAHAEQWQHVGAVIDRLDGGALGAIREQLMFDLPPANPHARPDWVGQPRAGKAGILLAEPSEQLLGDAAGLLSRDGVGAILHAGADRELTISSFRPIRYLPHAEDMATLPSPVQTRRAVIFLTKSDRVSVETLDGTVVATTAFEAGSILVYDPQRVQLRLEPGLDIVDLVEIALMPRHPEHPFRVIWAGLCDWPADPFNYSVSDMPAFPPFRSEIVRERSKG